MTNNHRVVIGAAFGDEGKGLLTDYYAAEGAGKTPVVRFNGGAQAGHTVVTPQGERHVFSHVGSGAFIGAHTILTKDFIVNPLALMKELRLLKRSPTIIVDTKARVTTPFDMMANRARHIHNRHGTCGMGINETVNRHTNSVFSLSVEDLFRDSDWKAKVRLIRDVYHQAIDIEDEDDLLLDGFIGFIEDFKDTIHPITNVMELLGPAVFEGAQGLLLDEEHAFFPHVTRSKTGLDNIYRENLDVTYVLRAYMTRHGNGPFPTETLGLSFEDNTNAPNPWQGMLRFGWLDLDLIGEAIRKDGQNRVIASTTLAMTHMDQLSGMRLIKFKYQGEIHSCYPEDLPHKVQRILGLEHLVIANGPTRNHVWQIN